MLMFTHRAKDSWKLFSGILEFPQQAEYVQNYWHIVLKRLISITKVSCERDLAFRGEDRHYIGSAEKGNYFGTLELLAQYDDFLNQHLYPEARKVRKPSLQTTCPRQQRRMPNSLLITSLSANSCDPVINRPVFHAISSSAVRVRGTAFQI